MTGDVKVRMSQHRSVNGSGWAAKCARVEMTEYTSAGSLTPEQDERLRALLPAPAAERREIGVA
jgi:hypothetical protein